MGKSSNSQKRVVDIPQRVKNVGKCGRSCPFPDAHECMSKYFPDVTGITSCTSEVMHDTRTEMERHGILNTYKLKTKTHALGAENWQLTRRDLLHQYSQSLCDLLEVFLSSQERRQKCKRRMADWLCNNYYNYYNYYYNYYKYYYYYYYYYYY